MDTEEPRSKLRGNCACQRQNPRGMRSLLWLLQSIEDAVTFGVSADDYYGIRVIFFSGPNHRYLVNCGSEGDDTSLEGTTRWRRRPDYVRYQMYFYRV